MRILVTGATGWVGKSAIRVLLDKFENIEVLGTSRFSKSLFVCDRKVIPLVTNDEALTRCNEFDAMVHASFPTQNYVEELGETRYRSLASQMNTWLEQFLESSKLDFVFLTSSGAVTLLEKSPMNVDPYAEMKRDEEIIVKAFAKRSFAIGRLWAGSGRYMKNYKNYAMGQFIEAALQGRDIVVNSKVETFRQYCDVEQFCEVGIRLAMAGHNGTFDSGGVRISIQDLAYLVASRFRGISVKVGNEGRASSQPPNYFPVSADFEKLAKELGIDLLSIDAQVARTILAVRSGLGIEVEINGE